MAVRRSLCASIFLIVIASVMVLPGQMPAAEPPAGEVQGYATNNIQSQPQITIPEPEVTVSTNDLVRILRGATNVPFAAAAELIYRKHTVFLNPKGDLRARFDHVSVFSTEYELVSKLAESLVGSSVRVRKQPDGSYLYISDTKDKYAIHVIHDESDAKHFQGVYYIVAKRRFLTLKALLHLESRPDREGRIKYAVHIYSDSDSWILNLVSRISFVKHYLIHEVSDVVANFDSMYSTMLQNPQEGLQKLMKLRDPAGSVYFSDSDLELVKKFVDNLPQGQQGTNSPAK